MNRLDRVIRETRKILQQVSYLRRVGRIARLFKHKGK